MNAKRTKRKGKKTMKKEEEKRLKEWVRNRE